MEARYDQLARNDRHYRPDPEHGDPLALLGQRGMPLRDRTLALGTGLLDPTAQRRIADVERGTRIGTV